ncbi:MAG: hypothetical protein Q8Q54_08030 [Methylococcales bacterium]|nr:hypothetical protein [Methylococcales bacterium]MDP3838854.1 hypothetical protein [Methylococcales bacterium]
MIIKNKIAYLLLAVLGLTLVSLPSYAWRAAGNGRQGVARGAGGGGAAWNRNTGNAVVRGPQGNTAAVHRGGAYYGGGYRAPVHYGYRGGAYYGGNYGYSSGQVAAAGVAGLAVGAMAGAAVANANNQPTNTTVIVQQPVGMAIGTNLNNLPSGCQSLNINGIQYFQCSSGWMRSYGNYYQVVPAPF